MTDSTITITFCDRAENHVGMEQIGNLAREGFNLEDLKQFRRILRSYRILTDIYELSYDDNKAYILIARNTVDALIPGDLKSELINLQWDTKAKMYGRVVNKKARYNLCFADFNQEPDYAQGKGRVINFNSLPLLQQLRDILNTMLQDSISNDKVVPNLVAEGNFYYDIHNCGIGYHGDSERRQVIGIRLGASCCLIFQWYHYGQKIGSKFPFTLHDGDLYIMSDKAVGYDWKLKNIPTLRHAAGSLRFTA